MRDTLADIKAKLRERLYKNEEHVRLNLVARVLLELGWNVWDPGEVYPEFPVAPQDDKTKVDIALFAGQSPPSVFIEVKAVGGIAGKLDEVERQLRDYNRNNTALFTVLTDVQEWHLYYSQTGGEFKDKRFKTINVANDDLDDVITLLRTFLSKSDIVAGTAKLEAETYLQLSQKHKAMEDALPHARLMIHNPPFPSLPVCLQNLVKQKSFDITVDEAIAYISKAAASAPIVSAPYAPNSVMVPSLRRGDVLDPDHLPSVKFSTLHEAYFGTVSAANWNALAKVALREACDKQVTLGELQKMLTANLRGGEYSEDGFKPIPGTSVSVQGMDADKSLYNTVILAQHLRMPLRISLTWGVGPLSKQRGDIEWIP